MLSQASLKQYVGRITLILASAALATAVIDLYERLTSTHYDTRLQALMYALGTGILVSQAVLMTLIGARKTAFFSVAVALVTAATVLVLVLK